MTSWIHMASLWSCSSALGSSHPKLSAFSLLEHSMLPNRRTGILQDDIFIFIFLWYFKIWHSKRLEDLQALAGHFWTETTHSEQEAGSAGRRGGHHTGGFLQTGTPVSLPAWIANSVSPPSPKDCYWSFPRLLLGILGWHRGEQDTDFCMYPAGISVWDEAYKTQVKSDISGVVTRLLENTRPSLECSWMPAQRPIELSACLRLWSRKLSLVALGTIVFLSPGCSSARMYRLHFSSLNSCSVISNYSSFPSYVLSF